MGQALQFREEASHNAPIKKSAKAESPAMFVPRNAGKPRAGIGSSSRRKAIPSASGIGAMDVDKNPGGSAPSGKTQDDFRKLL